MTFGTAVPILFTSFVYRTNVWLVGYSRHKKKTTFIGGMELVSLRCNRDFTSASSYGLGWYKYAIRLSDTSSIPPMHGGFLLWSPDINIIVAFVFIDT